MVDVNGHLDQTVDETGQGRFDPLDKKTTTKNKNKTKKQQTNKTKNKKQNKTKTNKKGVGGGGGTKKAVVNPTDILYRISVFACQSNHVGVPFLSGHGQLLCNATESS